MSKAYTADGKRKSSMTHAHRAWTCPCGKVTHGNGGKSSHQRACAQAQDQIASVHRTIVERNYNEDVMSSWAHDRRYYHLALAEAAEARAKEIRERKPDA